MMTGENAITSLIASSHFLQSSSLHHRRPLSLRYEELEVKGKPGVGKKRAQSSTGREEWGATGWMFLVCVCSYEGLHRRGLCAGGHLEKHAHTHTHLAHDITAYRAAGRNVTEKGEALWRRGKRREGRKRRRRRGGKGLAREKSGTPTIWDRTDRGWTEVSRAKEGKTDKRRHTQ